jgi:hypothetical protein
LKAVIPVCWKLKIRVLTVSIVTMDLWIGPSRRPILENISVIPNCTEAIVTRGFFTNVYHYVELQKYFPK